MNILFLYLDFVIKFGFYVNVISDMAPSESEAPSEPLPPPRNYARHPNLYLPPYSIASETEAEDNGTTRCGLYDFHEDDLDDTPSSHSSFASQIHRPIASYTAGTAPEHVSLSMGSYMNHGSCSDVSNLCEIEDSEYEDGELKYNQHGSPIQTAV